MKKWILISTLFYILLAGCSTQKAMVQTSIPFPNKVIAHRGAWKNTNLPENSIASLKAAIQLGCGGSEFDVHMTSDEVLVINHNDDFLGLDIESHTYKELLKKKLSNGETIPTLENYLKEGMKQSHMKLVLEIKKSTISKERTLQLTQKVLDMVHLLKAEPWVVYISFDYDACKKVKESEPNVSVQYLDGNVSAEQLKADGLDADYHYSIFEKDENWIKNAKSLGLITNAWTVNDEKIMDNLLAQGIDFITTNEPEILLKKLKK